MSDTSLSQIFENYVNLRTQSDRVKALNNMRNENKFIPVNLAEDLLCLDLGIAEQIAVVRAVNSQSKLELEHFFTNLMSTSHQDVAVCALHEWAERTDQLLWFRLVQIIQLPHLPQRLRYSMLGTVSNAGGSCLLEAIANGPSIAEFSSAFQGLILQKAINWNFYHTSFDKVAHQAVQNLIQDSDQANFKTFPSALTYLARFIPKKLEELANSENLADIWRPIVQSLLRDSENTEKETANLEALFKRGTVTAKEIQRNWPSIVSRYKLTKNALTQCLDIVGKADALEAHMFFGTEAKALCDAICSMKDDLAFANACAQLEEVIPFQIPKELLDNAINRVQSVKDPQSFLANISRRLRVELSQLNQKTKDGDVMVKIKADSEQTIKRALKSKYDPNTILDFKPYVPATVGTEQSQQSRRDFFNLAYRDQKSVKSKNEDYWSQLTTVWQSPAVEALTKLTTAARQAPALWQVCYIHTLGRFKGENQAALKLLDYIRSDEELEIRAVINALGGIATPRAYQELISAITRPNINTSMQLEICNILNGKDLSSVQGEIRSAISDLKPSTVNSENDREVHEALEALLLPESEKKVTDKAVEASATIQNDVKELKGGNLDQSLSAKIPHFQDMSSEVRRALRTAEFFYLQTTGTDSHNVIDLSPVIDMQYKALELTFREMFEEPCRQVINTGILQRKLDVIGYARPIEQQMNQFENYVSSLDIINTIPFFSKFKLRKMLRAICQFRPGKRFTLDGLKAFGLFFLCFGRNDCRYGLMNLFPMKMGDKELAEFCKKLHVFQDFRNRAAHEGFQPEANHDIEEIWRATGEIVDVAFKIKMALAEENLNLSRDSQAVQGYKPAKGVQIVHKKVS